MLQYVLTYGTKMLDNVGNVYYSAEYNNQFIRVNIAVIEGILRIADAWVQTR